MIQAEYYERMIKQMIIAKYSEQITKQMMLANDESEF